MTTGPEDEPPRVVSYPLEEALAVLEDARDALIDAGHLVAVVGAEG